MEVIDVLKEGFKKWLTTLGYAKSTVYASTNYVRDFFFYLKENEINRIELINFETISNYHKYLQTRKSKTKLGSLSNNYIISNINALKRFSKYLNETGKANIEIKTELQTEKANTKTILTQSEIKTLYKACDNTILGIRDRAILAVFYGCGLRRSEGINLNLSDVLLKEKLIHVKNGKGYKERYVPMTEAIKEDLENYIYVAREQIISLKSRNLPNSQALFLSMRTNRLCQNALLLRIHKLIESAKIEKAIGVHSLRHSIATHLLQSGLTLEEVSQFLGHSSLESTQIYTHVSET